MLAIIVILLIGVLLGFGFAVIQSLFFLIKHKPILALLYLGAVALILFIPDDTARLLGIFAFSCFLLALYTKEKQLEK